MLHIALHFLVPVAVALTLYRDRWAAASLLLLAGLVVDVDHLLADPIYDPARCSLGFHPLHTWPAVVTYVALFLVPLAWRRPEGGVGTWKRGRWVYLVGLGLLLHMALDGLDCVL